MSTVISRHTYPARVSACIALLSLIAAFPATSKPSFTLFESGQVRPLALSPDGKHSMPSTRLTTGSKYSMLASVA